MADFSTITIFWPMGLFHFMQTYFSMRSITVLMSVFVLLLVCFTTSGAAVANIDSELNFEVISSDWTPFALPVYGDVRQGETDYYTSYVPSGATTLEISLTWDASNGDELKLTVQTPTGAPYVFVDNVDGLINGKIAVRTSIPAGMTATNWGFSVYGLSVDDIASYTLKINC